MVGLKPIYGGSTPPFLGSSTGLVQRQALRMCGRAEGSHIVILGLLRCVQLIELHVWQRRLLR